MEATSLFDGRPDGHCGLVEAVRRTGHAGGAMTPRPLVSIGMPLPKAGRHRAEALDSLLAQDYRNLELIISDNASTDATESTCRQYAARDSRISYERTESNQGAVWNFNRVFEVAKGDYFMWAAHDDIRAMRYVSRCVDALEARPDAVLCCTGVGFMDEDGHDIEPWIELVRPVGRTPRARVSEIARARYWLDVYGLMRRSTLAQTRLAQPVWGFDVVVVMEMCMRGPVLFVPERLFYYRADPQKTVQYVASSLGSISAQGAVPVNWSAMTLELARGVWHSPLNPLHRAALIVQLLFQICVFTAPLRTRIRKHLAPNLRAPWKDRRFGPFAALLVVTALVFPVQNRLVRGGYRLLPPRNRTPQTPV